MNTKNLSMVLAAVACLLRPGLGGAEPAAPSDPPSTPQTELEPQTGDPLGEIIVEATRDESGRIWLPPLVVRPSDGTRAEVIALHAVVARDLELSGIFEVDSGLGEVPEDDMRPRVILDVQVDGDQPPRMMAHIERSRGGKKIISDVVIEGTTIRDRPASHRLTDRVLGELTGREGAFAGRLALVRRPVASDPRLYVADPDGRDLKVITPASQVVVATAFFPGGPLYYTASINNDAIQLYRQGERDPIAVEPRGSIYGLSFGPKGRVALSIARGPRIEVWTGKQLDTLERVRESKLDMHPTLAPDGRVAFAGETRGSTRIFVGDRAVTPPRASSPTWCDHPKGPRLVWVERSSKSSWVWSRVLGKPAEQLLAVRGKIAAASCSPDGRVLVFSYEGRALEGSGIYIGNVDVLRPRQVLAEPARGLSWGTARSP